jgi:uncharacterized protein (UPF0212 family)
MRLKGEIRCPECGKELDGAIEAHEWAEDVMPKDGDLGVCIGCAAVVVYTVKDGEHALRALTDAERERTKDDPVVIKARSTALMYQALVEGPDAKD